MPEKAEVEAEVDYFDKEFKPEDVAYVGDDGCWVRYDYDKSEIKLPEDWKDQLYHAYEENLEKAVSSVPPEVRAKVGEITQAVQESDEYQQVKNTIIDDVKSVNKAVDELTSKAAETIEPIKKEMVEHGIFSPAMSAAKKNMGEAELNKTRAEVIALHSKVITKFVDTTESEFGRIALKKMFEAADKDGDGSLSQEEVRDAL